MTVTRHHLRHICGVAALAVAAVLAPPPVQSQATPSLERVQLETPAGTLAGTLLVPATTRPPVVLLIAGSSATDRDGNTPLHSGKIDHLKLLAEALGRDGIASLRYDQRGVGEIDKMAERDVRFDDLISDAAHWIVKLRNDGRFSTITVAGHDLGSLIGMVAARAARADALVSFVGVARPASNVSRAYDPSVELARLNVPVLTVQDTMDLPVPAADAAPGAIAKFIRDLRPQRHPEGERRSPRSVVIREIDGCRIAIEYGRPSKRGRTIWGALVPWSRWWMPGADEATTLTTSASLRFGSLAVPAGDYTLYTQPAENGLTFIINAAVGVFHTTYQSERDLGRIGTTMAATPAPVEQLTIDVVATNEGGRLVLSWDDREYSAPFVVVKGERR